MRPIIYPVATPAPVSSTATPNYAPPMIYPPVSYPSPQNTNPFIFQPSGSIQQSTPSPTVVQPMPSSPTIFQPMPPAPTQGGIISQTVSNPLASIATTTTTTTTTTTAAPQTGGSAWDGSCGISRSNTNRVVGGTETRRG